MEPSDNSLSVTCAPVVSVELCNCEDDGHNAALARLRRSDTADIRTPACRVIAACPLIQHGAALPPQRRLFEHKNRSNFFLTFNVGLFSSPTGQPSPGLLKLFAAGWCGRNCNVVNVDLCIFPASATCELRPVPDLFLTWLDRLVAPSTWHMAARRGRLLHAISTQLDLCLKVFELAMS